MKLWNWLRGGVALGAWLPVAGFAGSIVGTVRALPPAIGGENVPAGAYESRRYRYVEKIDYEHLRDFVVYIDQPLAGPETGAPPLATVTTTQKDANFDPHVLPVPVGSTVRWPNEDDIFHNVFSISDPAQFDLGYYKKEKVPEVVFTRTGVVDANCQVHGVPNLFIAGGGVFATAGAANPTLTIVALSLRLAAFLKAL